MKIKPQHYAILKTAALVNQDKIADHREFLVKEGKSKDIEKRLR
jgi:hypothetical protein